MLKLLKQTQKTWRRWKNGKKIKAAGGIKNFDDAEEFVKAGADRLGTSRLVAEMLK